MFKCSVDTRGYLTKPSTDTVDYVNKYGHSITQSAAISLRIAKYPKTLSISDLSDLVGRGYSFCPATFSGDPPRRKKDLFCQAQIVALDFDDGTVPTWHAEPSLIYESFSSKPDHIKLRAVWELDTPVTDLTDYEDILRGFAEIYPTVDKSCLEGARLLFGTNKSTQTSNTVLTTSELTRVPLVTRTIEFSANSGESLQDTMLRIYKQDSNKYRELNKISDKLEHDVRKVSKERDPTLFKAVAWFVATPEFDPDKAYEYIVKIAQKNPAFFTEWKYDFVEVCEAARNWALDKR